jgi:hypothetical protein
MISKLTLRHAAITLGATLALAIINCTAHAAILTLMDSNVDAYFGSQSDAYQASDPAVLAPWPAVGPGPYLGTALPGVPAPPGSTPGPPYPGGINVPYSPAAHNSAFNDGAGNTASSSIQGGINGIGATTNDATMVANGTLVESTGSSYDYEQLNFGIDYQVALGAVTQGSVVTRGISISGNVSPGGFVQFGGQLNFWDATTSASLGAPLTFSYFNNSGGPFATFLVASQFESSVVGGDILRVSGDFFTIGDPGIDLHWATPEPSTYTLLATGAACLAWVMVRRQKRPLLRT